MVPAIKDLTVPSSAFKEHGGIGAPSVKTATKGLHKQAEMLLEGWVELLTLSAGLALRY